VNKIDGMADSDDGGWQGFERVIDCDSDWRNVTETSTQTPRGWTIDMVTSGIGGALAGYLLVQFLTLFLYMNAPVLRPKQPHILLIQTWSAMMLSGSLLVYHGHFTRERGFFSICTLWDIWAIFISLGFFLNCQALRVVKVHRKRVEELDTNQMILNVNLRKQSEGTGVPGWRGVVKRKVARNRHKLVFYKDLFLWMLPWLVTAAIATADGATCFDSYKRARTRRRSPRPLPSPLGPRPIWPSPLAPSPCPRLALPQPRTAPHTHFQPTLTSSAHPPPTLPPSAALHRRSTHSSSCVSRCYPWPGLYCWGTSSISSAPRTLSSSSPCSGGGCCSSSLPSSCGYSSLTYATTRRSRMKSTTAWVTGKPRPACSTL